MREGLSRRQRQVLGLEVPAEPDPADGAPTEDAGQAAGEMPEEPGPLSVPGTLRGAHWRPPRKAVLGVLACVVAALVVVGARTWWAERRAEEVRPAVARTAPHPAVTGARGGARAAAPQDGAAAPSPSPGGPVLVHVVGRVRRPGVVRLGDGGRVEDAVRAAGGVSPGADLTRVNLARPAVDGEQVVVPAVGEAAPPSASAPSAPATRAASGSAQPSAPVNLNTADAAALDALPGVGPALAQRILEHRTAHGPFRSVDALDDVPGIGPAMLEKLRDRCTV